MSCSENIVRSLRKTIDPWLFKGKIISIFGARQVGKTTFARMLLEEFNCLEHYYDCELISIKQILERCELSELRNHFSGAKIIVLDEAQLVLNIGKTLKILHDHMPNTQVIATGSSSFDLANRTQEPLTGRGIEFILYPYSIAELSNLYKTHEIEERINDLIIYGSYPEIVHSTIEQKRILLDNLASKYLYKDILTFDSVQKSDLILKLLQLLALQIGNEVSLNEIANKLQVTRKTIDRYLDILQKSYVIFKLQPLSRNMRKEIGKKNKWYFYDLGLRNSLLSRFQSINLRDDIGPLWENFCILERMKYRQNNNIAGTTYFWRTHDKKEIDYLEENNGLITGFEFKWNQNAKYKPPTEFLETYTNSSTTIIHKNNWQQLLQD